MRSLALIIVLAAAPAFGQEGPFSVLSSSPAPGDSAVAPTTTVRFTFSAPLDTTHRFSNSLPVAFARPDPRVEIRRVHYSPDLTSIFLDVAHADTTDYAWVLTQARSRAGEWSCAPYALSYTTRATHGTGEVYGDVHILAVSKGRNCYPGPIPVLFDGPLSDSVRIAAATVVAFDSVRYMYTFRIPRVRPGTYWPALLADWDDDGRITIERYGNDYRLEGFTYEDFGEGETDRIVVSPDSSVQIVMFYVLPAVEPNAELPGTARLLPNYPNPFNPTTTLAFALERPLRLRLVVHDLLGREVAVVATGVFASGRHTFAWDAGGLASGVYVARLSGDAFTLTRKLLLVK